MRKIFEEELQDLHVLFSEMGKMVNEAIYISVKGFVNHDKELAAEVIAHDVAINQREAEIEKRCFELIALHQPVTGNLRRIVTIMKACADLERMADHAVSIAKSTIRVKGNKRNSDIEAAIAEQSEKVKVMVEEVLAAYIKTDIEKSQRSCPERQNGRSSCRTYLRTRHRRDEVGSGTCSGCDRLHHGCRLSRANRRLCNKYL